MQVSLWGEVDRGFGRTGVQSFALEGVLGELQVINQSIVLVGHCKQILHLLLMMACTGQPAWYSGPSAITLLLKTCPNFKTAKLTCLTQESLLHLQCISMHLRHG